MKKRSKTSALILPLVLIVYALVMAYMGYPHYRESGNWLEFYLLIAASIVLAILLYLVRRRKDKIRDNFNNK